MRSTSTTTRRSAGSSGSSTSRQATPPASRTPCSTRACWQPHRARLGSPDPRGGRVALESPEAHMSPIHPADVAEVAAHLLTRPGFRGRQQILSGPSSLTVREMVAVIAEAEHRALAPAARRLGLGAPRRVCLTSKARRAGRVLPSCTSCRFRAPESCLLCSSVTTGAAGHRDRPAVPRRMLLRQRGSEVRRGPPWPCCGTGCPGRHLVADASTQPWGPNAGAGGRTG
jgi:hypothetical protein